MTLAEGVPFSDAVRAFGRAGVQRPMLLADSGIVPLDRDWWRRLTAMLDLDPTLLCYAFADPQPGGETSAMSFLSGSTPLLAAGPQIASGILNASLELETFEGVVHHAVAAAVAAGSSERLGWLRLLATVRSSRDGPIGAVRLDDALVAAALRVRTAAVSVKKSNLVQLAARTGSG